MARAKEFDDQTVVRAARDVFWERGYVATSLAQLQAATGLSKSSLYETYGSKRGLFGRAAANYLDEIIAPRLRPLETPDAGPAELVEYFSSLARSFRDSPERLARRGCLVLNTAMELNDLDAAAAEIVTSYRARIRQAIFAAVRGAAAPERTADILTAALIGLMVTARLDPLLAASLADALAAQVRA